MTGPEGESPDSGIDDYWDTYIKGLRKQFKLELQTAIEECDPSEDPNSSACRLVARHKARAAEQEERHSTPQEPEIPNIFKHAKIIMTRARKKAKEFYTTKHLPQGAILNRTRKQQREYRDLLDYKRDAFRHILANAWLGQFHNHTALRGLGQGYELWGGVKNVVKHRKFEWSGRDEDLKNNELGLELSKKFIVRGITWDTAALEVKKIVDRGNFFIEYEDKLISYSDIEQYRDPIRQDIPAYVDDPNPQDIKRKRKIR